MSFIPLSSATGSPGSACGRGVGQQCDLAGVLDRDRDVALVLAAVAGDPTGPDLAAVGDELPQQAGVLVVDVLGLVLAECADLRLRLAQDRLGHGGAPVVRVGRAQKGGSSSATGPLPAGGAEPHGSSIGAEPP